MNIRIPPGLRPEDDSARPPGPEANYNDSMYFNFYDRGIGIGGFLRIGNRANEGQAEVTAALYEPDHSALFRFRREPITDGKHFRAGGCEFRTLDPFRRLQLSFDHEVIRLADPRDLADPSAAFQNSPREPLLLDLDIEGLSDIYFVEAEKGKWDFYEKHYEQLHAARGSLTLRGRRLAFDGLGLRDHSWGPRWWQSPDHYRWFTCNFSPDFGFMASLVALRDGTQKRTGFVWRNGSLQIIRDFDAEIDYEGAQRYHDNMSLSLHTDAGTLRVEGEVMTLLPLRNRREDQVTRITEGLTRYECGDHVGYGLSEFLDHTEPAK